MGAASATEGAAGAGAATAAATAAAATAALPPPMLRLTFSSKDPTCQMGRTVLVPHNPSPLEGEGKDSMVQRMATEDSADGEWPLQQT